MMRYFSLLLISVLVACADGSKSTDNNSPDPVGNSGSETNVQPDNSGDPSDPKLTDNKQISRLLNQASFGATSQTISAMQGQVFSSWLKSEFDKPISLHSPLIVKYQGMGLKEHIASMAFWKNAITANDQLRQRMAFALSQILVISDFGESLLFDYPLSIGYYQDLMTQHAFGNYRELLEAVTYSPAMGFYLTYMGSEKGDPTTGRMPDENYAREILQLFTIGLVKLNMDGSVVLDGQGKAIETYTNKDITGLAKVFTGLNLYEGLDSNGNEPDENSRHARAMQTFAESHSTLEKTFLGQTIAANTGATESITQALDIIFAHQNLAPFVSRQLIQRFVTSHPSAQYINRVANAFETGTYQFSDGTRVGNQVRGDLKATLAAVLTDKEARDTPTNASFGKVKEPILRFTQWARAFAGNTITPEYMFNLWDSSASNSLGQHPYRSPSVFNFYRPGFIKPASHTGQAGLTMPELQIVNATTVPGYFNFLSFFINGEMANETYIQKYAEFVETDLLSLDPQQAGVSFLADYANEIALAHDANGLINHLETLLVSGALSDTSRARILNAINSLPLESKTKRVRTAVLMVMTTPEFLVQL